jgi:nitrogen fixation protein NifU and related proteins
MPAYSDKVMDHFMHPRNVGEIADADGVGEVGNPVCGDMMSFYIKVKDDRLADVKFKTFGCGAAIAVSSMVSEMAMGKTLEEAMKITPQSVADELEGLPKQKFHCSNLGAQALHKAIEDYESKKGHGGAATAVKTKKTAAKRTSDAGKTATVKAGGRKKTNG